MIYIEYLIQTKLHMKLGSDRSELISLGAENVYYWTRNRSQLAVLCIKVVGF